MKKPNDLIRAQYEAVGDTNIEWYHIDLWLKKFDLSVSQTPFSIALKSYIEAFPDTLEVLQTLATRYTLVVASNAARIFVEKELSHTGLYVISPVSFQQPPISAWSKRKAVLQEALQYFKRTSPDEIVHIGDHFAFDFETPSQLGIEAYHIVYDVPSESDESSGQTMAKPFIA